MLWILKHQNKINLLVVFDSKTNSNIVTVNHLIKTREKKKKKKAPPPLLTLQMKTKTTAGNVYLYGLNDVIDFISDYCDLIHLRVTSPDMRRLRILSNRIQ